MRGDFRWLGLFVLVGRIGRGAFRLWKGFHGREAPLVLGFWKEEKEGDKVEAGKTD